MLKVVLDSNIYVSAILKPDGTQASLVKMAMHCKFKLIISTAIIEEVRDVLTRPRIKKYLKVTANEIERFFINIYTHAIFVDFEEVIRVVKNDPDDDVIVTTAVSGETDYIISGDQDLLCLKKFRNIKILNAKDFLECFFR